MKNLKLMILFLGVYLIFSCGKDGNLIDGEVSRGLGLNETKFLGQIDNISPLFSSEIDTLNFDTLWVGQSFNLGSLVGFTKQGNLTYQIDTMGNKFDWGFSVKFTEPNISSFCCDINFEGYGPMPFPPYTPSVGFTYQGYDEEEAEDYWFHLKIYKFQNNQWVVIHDHLWPDRARPCDGTIYGGGFVLNFGICPGLFRVFGALAHTDSDNNLVYCTGDQGYFWHDGVPTLCDVR